MQIQPRNQAVDHANRAAPARQHDLGNAHNRVASQQCCIAFVFQLLVLRINRVIHCCSVGVGLCIALQCGTCICLQTSTSWKWYQIVSAKTCAQVTRQLATHEWVHWRDEGECRSVKKQPNTPTHNSRGSPPMPRGEKRCAAAPCCPCRRRSSEGGSSSSGRRTAAACTDPGRIKNTNKTTHNLSREKETSFAAEVQAKTKMSTLPTIHQIDKTVEKPTKQMTRQQKRQY